MLEAGARSNVFHDIDENLGVVSFALTFSGLAVRVGLILHFVLMLVGWFIVALVPGYWTKGTSVDGSSFSSPSRKICRILSVTPITL